MRILISVSLALLFSCSGGGAVSPREAFEVLVNSIENTDIVMFKTIQSKDNIKFFEDIAGKLSKSNATQRNYLSKRYGVSRNFCDDVNYNSVMEFYLLTEKNGNLLKSLKSGIAGIDRTDSRAVIATNAGTQIVFVKENSRWKVDLGSL